LTLKITVTYAVRFSAKISVLEPSLDAYSGLPVLVCHSVYLLV